MFRQLLLLSALLPLLLAGTHRPFTEWTAHRSEDGANPSPAEQEMLFLANRARQDPRREGVWLATDPQVQARFGGFPVNWEQMQAEFAALPAQPPVAYDSRILAGEDAHAAYMLEICQQTHAGQRERVEQAGFSAGVHRIVAWTLAENALWGHAGFQIDFGGPASQGGMQTGRPHRSAIMGGATHAGYGSAKGARRSCQPQLSFSGSFTTAVNVLEPARFLVGTIYRDVDGNGRFDAGEGIGGVKIRLSVGPWDAVTSPAGGYAVPLPDEAAIVFATAIHGGKRYPKMVAAGTSVLLDWVIP